MFIPYRPTPNLPFAPTKPLRPYPRRGLLSRLRVVGTALAAVVLVALLSVPVSDLGRVVGGAATTPVPTDNAYGFSTSLDTLSSSELNTKLTAIKATGADWVRFDISWEKVQPTNPAHSDWSTYDRINQAVVAHHLHGLGIIEFTPVWARPNSCLDSKMCPPNNPAQFATFAAAVVGRYAPSGLRDWEIWNEPNISYRYHPGTNPAGYAAILKATYKAIKQVDPAAVVVAGGTAPSETNATNRTPADFIKALYANGAKGSFDAIAAHPYTYPNLPSDPLPLGAWDQMQAMHAIMAANGDGAKHIWITEFGAPTNGPNLAGEYVSESTQAAILTDAVHLYRSYPWSGPFFWYDLKDTGSGSWTSENSYGLVRSDDSHKPSYDAWVSAVAPTK